jgi:uncharacterized membrane protein (UPF0127 family)
MRTLAMGLVLLLLAGCGGGSSEPSARTASGSEASSGCPIAPAKKTASDLRTVVIDSSGCGKVEVWVEIADNFIGRYIGLRNRESLPENHGMLFVYTEEDRLSFTMNDTLIPLSIAFLDSEGRIVDIQDMKPLTDGPYLSAQPAQYALEVNQGFFEEHGVEVGDRAELPG